MKQLTPPQSDGPYFFINGLRPNTSYTVQLQAYAIENQKDLTGFNRTNIITVKTAAIKVPVIVSATAIDNTSVRLTYKNIDYTKGQYVYVSGAKKEVGKDIPSSVNSDGNVETTINNLVPGRAYTFRVSSYVTHEVGAKYNENLPRAESARSEMKYVKLSK